jgi:hypothetical protein
LEGWKCEKEASSWHEFNQGDTHMVKTRTISVNELTVTDRRMLEICSKISELLESLIPNKDKAKEFMKQYGRINYSRDAGMGVGAGKLQRDALTTRGHTDKSPFSNRNFRWHPLVLAHTTPPYAHEVDSIEVSRNKIIFVIESARYRPEDVCKLERVYCAPFQKWSHLVKVLSGWGSDEWSENRCTIPALEYSTPEFSVGTFASLGTAVACKLYGAPEASYDKVMDLLASKGISGEVLGDMPPLENLVKCPLCLVEIDKPPAELHKRKRPQIWQPSWRASKRAEGAEGALQIVHSFPLSENEVRHRPTLVRYGHRWCNVAMADHSVDETVDFMKAVVLAHERAGE